MKREARGKQDVDPFWLWGSNDVIGPLVLALGGVIETERRRRGGERPKLEHPSLPFAHHCSRLHEFNVETGVLFLGSEIGTCIL